MFPVDLESALGRLQEAVDVYASGILGSDVSEDLLIQISERFEQSQLELLAFTSGFLIAQGGMTCDEDVDTLNEIVDRIASVRHSNGGPAGFCPVLSRRAEVQQKMKELGIYRPSDGIRLAKQRLQQK